MTIGIKNIETILDNQYDLPHNTLVLAGCWQWKQISPSLIGSCSNGMHKVLADPVRELSASNNPSLVSMPDLSLTFSSQCFSWHHDVNTIFFLLSSVINSSQLSAVFFFSFILFKAFWYMLFWIFSRSSLKVWLRFSWESWIFSPLYLRTALTSFFSISFGPSSSLIGTPLSSQWLYFHPGL